MKVLVICRDNIGDSILATPLIASLNTTYNAVVDVLTNSYAAPVFCRNHHIRAVHEYSKSKHCEGFLGVIFAAVARIKTIFSLRQERYDAVLIAKSSWDIHSIKCAAHIKAKRVIAYGSRQHALIDTLLPPAEPMQHIAETLFGLSAGLSDRMALPAGLCRPGKSTVYPDPYLTNKFRTTFAAVAGERIIALQISARKPSQQWSADNFIALAQKIKERFGCRIFLFWSPGNECNPMHPGDDFKAEYIANGCTDISVEKVPTQTLEELKAALSMCSIMVSSDGGAVHIAAALGLPVVALYGNSEPAHWYPWFVPHKTLRGREGHVNDLQVDNVFSALEELIPYDEGVCLWNSTVF